MSSKWLIILAVLVTTSMAANVCNATHKYTLVSTNTCYKRMQYYK